MYSDTEKCSKVEVQPVNKLQKTVILWGHPWKCHVHNIALSTVVTVKRKLVRNPTNVPILNRKKFVIIGMDTFCNKKVYRCYKFSQ